MKNKYKVSEQPISMVSRTHPFKKNDGPKTYVDPLFADQELRDLCHWYPVEALEGELKAQVWINTEMVVNGISQKTWLLTEQYMIRDNGSKTNVYDYREYRCPVILKDLFEYLYPKFIKCTLSQFVRMFCFDGNPFVPVVWYGKLKDLHYFLQAIEMQLKVIPGKAELFIRLDSKNQAEANRWWKPAKYKSITEMKSKSTTKDESELSDLNDIIREWKKKRIREEYKLLYSFYRYTLPIIQFTTFHPPLWFDAIPRTVIHAREIYRFEEILESTKKQNKRLADIADKTLKDPPPIKDVE